MRPARLLLVAVTLAGPVAARAASPIALLPASGANVDPGTLTAAHDVFRSYLEETGAFTVRVTAGGPVADVEPSPSQAIASAQEVGVAVAAVLRLSMLGSILHVRLTAYGAPDGRVLWSDSLQAGAPGDLDPVLKRLATGWARGQKATAAAEIDTVTEKEAAPLLKKQATRQFGVRLGAFRVYDTSHAEDPTGTGGGIYWLYDARSYLIDVTFDAYGGKNATNLAGGFGFYLPLTRTDFSPYIGGGLRLASTRANDDWNSGFQPYVAGGLVFGRLSSVGIRGEVAWLWSTYGNAGDHTQILVGSLAAQY